MTKHWAATCAFTALINLMPPAAAKGPAPTAAATPAIVRHHAALVHAAYEDALASARTMQQSIDVFTAAPSPATLEAARKAWLAAREWYGRTEAFRFYGGPIDDARGPEGRINAWPMDEAYVDAVQGKPGAGIVNNRKQRIDKKTLSAMNERGGEENVATGWHAIEFLLWGQDLYADSPGQRSADDFIDGKALNADRRRQYLKVATALLIDDLGFLVNAWAPVGKANYRARFEAGGSESLRKIFVGLGSLSRGELAGERMEVALASREQEDEHSCFSDNTHRDIVNNALGIENVWLGRALRLDGSTLQGPGLRDGVAAKDAALADRVTAQIAASLSAVNAIQAPFDREILGNDDAPGRQRVRAAVAALVQQSQGLVEAAGALGIKRLALVDPKK